MNNQPLKAIILAQPKSASTSLLKTVGRVSAVAHGQQFFVMPVKRRNLISSVFQKSVNLLGRTSSASVNLRLRDAFPALHYSALALAHSDIADFGIDDIEYRDFRYHYELHKQHFPPTEKNIQVLEGVPKVILTRNVGSSMDSYRRVPQKTKLKQILSNSRFFADRLEEELCEWQEGWRQVAQSDEKAMLLDFEDLVASEGEAIHAVLNHFGFSHIRSSENIVLAKERHYR